MTHKTGGPWSQVYVRGSKHTPIPTESIENYFVTTEEKLLTIDEELGDIQVGEWSDVI